MWYNMHSEGWLSPRAGVFIPWLGYQGPSFFLTFFSVIFSWFASSP